MAKIPIGIQLYSVREECEKDLPKVLAAVKKAGYEGVEYDGYYGRGAGELKGLQDQYGLKCCGTHIGLDALLGDQLQKTIEFNKILGNKYLVVPGLGKDRTNSIAAWTATAKLFGEIAARAKPSGMKVGYHNHSSEFRKMEGQVPWEVF